MPEHYSLTMEIAKDRTTNATVETCTADMFNSDQCPRDAAVGHLFVRRSLNEPCRKMVSVGQCWSALLLLAVDNVAWQHTRAEHFSVGPMHSLIMLPSNLLRFQRWM